MDGFFFLLLLLAWAACGYLGYYVSLQKRREPSEGIILGLVFGPIGAVIVALLPSGDRRAPSARRDTFRPRSSRTVPPGSSTPLVDLGLPPDPPKEPAQGWTIGAPDSEDDGPAPDAFKGLRI